MVTPLDSRKLRQEIARKYELDPRGWHFVWNADDKGHYNLFIAEESKLWWLKEKMINPMLTIGCGIRPLHESDLHNRIFEKSNIGPSFGFRPIQEELMKKIFADLAEGKTPRDGLSEVLSSEPRTLEELDTSFVMQGPFHQMSTLAEILSDKQRELDKKLNTELEKLILKRYPQLSMSYT